MRDPFCDGSPTKNGAHGVALPTTSLSLIPMLKYFFAFLIADDKVNASHWVSCVVREGNRVVRV